MYYLIPKNVRVGSKRTRVSIIKNVFQDFCRLTLTNLHNKYEEYCVDDNEIFIRKEKRYIRFSHIENEKLQVTNEIEVTYSTIVIRKFIQQFI